MFRSCFRTLAVIHKLQFGPPRGAVLTGRMRDDLGLMQHSDDCNLPPLIAAAIFRPR